jgi:hypothetical protein
MFLLFFSDIHFLQVEIEKLMSWLKTKKKTRTGKKLKSSTQRFNHLNLSKHLVREWFPSIACVKESTASNSSDSCLCCCISSLDLFSKRRTLPPHTRIVSCGKIAYKSISISSGGPTGYAGYAPAYPVLSSVYVHVYQYIFVKK